MNTFLQDNLYAIILFLLFIILLLIALIGSVLVKILLTKKDNPEALTSFEKERPVLLPTIETPAKLRKLAEEIVIEKYYCDNHPDIASAGTCLIC